MSRVVNNLTFYKLIILQSYNVLVQVRHFLLRPEFPTLMTRRQARKLHQLDAENMTDFIVGMSLKHVGR